MDNKYKIQIRSFVTTSEPVPCQCGEYPFNVYPVILNRADYIGIDVTTIKEDFTIQSKASCSCGLTHTIEFSCLNNKFTSQLISIADQQSNYKKHLNGNDY